MTASSRARWVRVRVRRLAHGAGLPLPAYQSKDAAGLDLLAAVDEAAPLYLASGARALVPTGLVLELPKGYEAQVRPRSGLALRHGVTVLNSPGTIDSDYRGEVQVILINLGTEPFAIRRGERIAQLVVHPVVRGDLVAAATVSDTKRGAGGFGSTGAADRSARPAGAAPRSKKKSVPGRGRSGKPGSQKRKARRS